MSNMRSISRTHGVNWCEVCQIKFNFANQNNVIPHLNGKKHKKLRKILEKSDSDEHKEIIETDNKLLEGVDIPYKIATEEMKEYTEKMSKYEKEIELACSISKEEYEKKIMMEEALLEEEAIKEFYQGKVIEYKKCDKQSTSDNKNSIANMEDLIIDDLSEDDLSFDDLSDDSDDDLSDDE